MDNQYSEFSDFFKKKLAEVEGTSNNWDKPDAQVKETLLRRISTTAQTHIPNTPFGFSKLIGGVLATSAILALCVLGFYTYHLHNNNTRLIQELQSNITSKNCEDSKKIKQQHAHELAALLQEKASIKQSSIAISEGNTRLEKQLQQQENELILLKNKLHSLLAIHEEKEVAFQFQISELNEQMSERINHIAHLEWQNKNWKLLYENVTENNARLLKENVPYYDYCETKDKGSLPIDSLSKRSNSPMSKELSGLSKYQSVLPSSIGKLKRKRFEIGYSFTFTQPHILFESKIENEEGFEQTGYGYGTYRNHHGLNGLSLAYSPRKRLWLKTGIHSGSQAFIVYFNTNVKYANFIDNEINTPESTIHNKLSYKTTTAYAQTVYPISIEFNKGEVFENDNMHVQIKNMQQLKYLHIPLGFEQYFGKKRIHGFLSGGFRFTRIAGTHTIQASVRANGRSIETVHAGQPQLFKPKYISSIYGGLGLDYQVFNNLHTRASFSLHQKLIKRNIYSIQKTADFDVGLYYRF